MKLTAESIHVIRGGRTVLRDVTVRLAGPGGVALVGPNGAGKSSLLLTLLGLLRPASGKVSLDDADIVGLGRRQIARQIAYVAQSVDGFEGFIVRDVVAAARYPYRHPLEPLDGNDLRIVDESMVTCGVTEFAKRSLESLSGGERQRVWLAAAIAQQTPILLLDEPAAALDPRHQAQLARLLRQLIAGGKLVVLVAHDLNLAAAIADRTLALRTGGVAFDGPTREFLASERLRELFQTPFALATTSRGATLVSAEFTEAGAI